MLSCPPTSIPWVLATQKGGREGLGEQGWASLKKQCLFDHRNATCISLYAVLRQRSHDVLAQAGRGILVQQLDSEVWAPRLG